MRFHYDVCPECGFENFEKKRACAACDNRLYSDDEESHRRYVTIVTVEHRKRNLIWYSGWAFLILMFCMPLLLLSRGSIRWLPGAGLWLAALVAGWQLIDLRKKRAASARFLAQHKHA